MQRLPGVLRAEACIEARNAEEDPSPNMPNVVLIRIVLVSAFVSSIVGGVYGYFAHNTLGTGVALGAVLGATFPVLDVFVFQGRIGPDPRRLPFPVYIGLRSIGYVVVIVVIEEVVVGTFLGPWSTVGITLVDIAFALAVSVAANLMFGMAQLLGPSVLLAFAVGRYHRPRREERALLFIDLTASTATAERLGEARFLDFLSAFIADVSQAVVENRGRFTNMSATRSSPPGVFTLIATTRESCGRVLPPAIGSRPVAAITCRTSASAPISARPCMAAPSSLAKSEPSRRRSPSSATR